MQGVRGEVIDQHPWRGGGVWMRSRNLEGMAIGYVIGMVEQEQQVEVDTEGSYVVLVSFLFFSVLFSLLYSFWECL